MPVSPASRTSGRRRPKLLHELLGVGARREAGNVGAGSGDRPAKLVDELLDDRALRASAAPPCRCSPSLSAARDCDASTTKVKPAGPEGFGQFRRNCAADAPSWCLRSMALAHQHQRLVQGIDQDRQRPRFGAALYAVELIDGGEIEGIGGQSVERIGGDSDDTAPDEEMRRISQCIGLRGLAR